MNTPTKKEIMSQKSMTTHCDLEHVPSNDKVSSQDNMTSGVEFSFGEGAVEST